MGLDEGRPKFFPVEALSAGRYLYNISSLVDSSPHHSRHWYRPGSVALEETFSCISKFTGTVLQWCASGSNSNISHKVSDCSHGSFPKRCEFSQTSYVFSTKLDLPRIFCNYRKNALQIPEFFNKFSRFAIRQLLGRAKELQFIPALSLAGNLVPPLDNIYRNFLAVSHENGNAVVERSLNHSPCEVEQRRCGDLHYENFNCPAHAVEPRTGIEFPTILDNIFEGSNTSLNMESEQPQSVFQVLVGTGSKTMKIVKIKSLKLYAFDVHPYDVCNKLASKYASLPENEVDKQHKFFSDLLREDISMTIRLVVSCNGIKISTVRDAFEKSLRARLIKMNPDTDYDCLRSFGSLFSEDIPIQALKAIRSVQFIVGICAGLSLTCTSEMVPSLSRQKRRLDKMSQI
ncbi:Chalcone isomerase [Cynara cardunculus var. scolymus]|uniref:Chalcone isomerase n=1 Tax=Cynara cardunculus var. scolymus TaxID=59895 RepID=A0A124R304_CYNCS|nr:Chalcone isomerase [Cynara cardunculus var. scolymus]